MISPVVTSWLVLASALAFLVFWFRKSCEGLLHNRPPLESEQEELESDRAPVRVFRQALRGHLDAPAGSGTQFQALERDFHALHYLLRRTSPRRFVRHSRCERMLIVDFHLTRAWLRLRSLLRGRDGRAGLEHLYDILDYFTAVLQHRLRAAMESFEPLPAYADAGTAHITVCSYCWRVRRPQGRAGGEWIAPQRFHRYSGAEPAAVSHGMCPDCYEHIVRPTLPRTVINR